MREKEMMNKESLLGCWPLQLDRWVRGTMGAFFSEPASLSIFPQLSQGTHFCSFILPSADGDKEKGEASVSKAISSLRRAAALGKTRSKDCHWNPLA